jgi:hypothetical protein
VAAQHTRSCEVDVGAAGENGGSSLSLADSAWDDANHSTSCSPSPVAGGCRSLAIISGSLITAAAG